uniref:Acrosin n=1 Tax=Romanomermis culicivorax TaxID=13658 RepID=A0A915JNZ5_ROMCU
MLSIMFEPPSKVSLQKSITSTVSETSTTTSRTVAVSTTTTDIPTSEETSQMYNFTSTTEFIVDITSTIPTCSSNQRPCMSSSMCISPDLICDKRADCPLADDEKHCTCLDYLTNQFPQRVCDNYPDCPDLSDEMHCTAYSSISAGSLAPAVEALNDAHSMDIFSYGYLFGRIRGTWYPACIDQDITVTETRDLCNALGFRELVSYRNEAAKLKFETVINFTRYHDIATSPQDVLSEHCLSRSIAHVQCAQETECGSRPLCGPNLKRIVGGSPAGPYCQPGVVALYKDGEMTCQAVVFNHEWLLTAAHCFYEATSSRWIARLGFYRQHSQSPYEQIRSIEYVIFHPDFTDTPLEVNDLALLKMDRPIHFGANLKPPCMPTIDLQDQSSPASPAPGDACVTAGWGYDHENSRTTVDELRSVVLTSIDIDVCNRSGPFKGLLTDGHLCFSGGSAWPKDACQGDSGGPMMCYSDRDDKLYLAGITSAGFGCARWNTPSLWTKVSHYVPWILSVLNSTDDD